MKTESLHEGDKIKINEHNAKIILKDEKIGVIYLKINDKIVAITTWFFDKEIEKNKMKVTKG